MVQAMHGGLNSLFRHRSKGAPDLIKAREVAEYIGTVHHEINYTVQEGLDAVRDVIYFIETYDVTTVRASHPCIYWRVSLNQWGSKWC